MNKVKVKRVAGPFQNIPFENYIQSPIGLVPKDGGRKTRLIFHLSYPRSGGSVNAGIPVEYCKVQYPMFEDAVRLCIRAGKGCAIAKSDMSMAYRHLPLNRESWRWLIYKVYHPVTGKAWFFVEKNLCFGCSISCKIFQDFSDSVSFITSFVTGEPNVNYLDDYFFEALIKSMCNGQMSVFLDICNEIKFPVALEKTYWGTTLLTFLGLLLDTVNQVVCILVEKIQKVLNMVRFFINKKNQKVTVHQVQKLCRFLNFLCRCVIPGRAFLRHTYSLVSGNNLKPFHHVRVNNEVRLDLEMWNQFLLHPNIFCIPFMDMVELNAE